MMRRLWQDLTAPWRYSPFLATCSLLLLMVGVLAVATQAMRLVAR